MQVVSSTEEIYQITSTAKANGETVALVPTMGALHNGHLHLVKEAQKHSNHVIVSIFVNPIQFDNPNDFDSYPRQLEQDCELLAPFNIAAVYNPTEAGMYPSRPLIEVSPGRFGQMMEGRHRPGHFEGVLTVVAKLFHQVSPDVAVFGLKDLQQFLIIKQMVTDLSFPIELVGVPIVRTEHGLAQSSRNQRLSSTGLQQATIIYKGLKQTEALLQTSLSIQEIQLEMVAFYRESSDFNLEYFEIVDGQTLLPADRKDIELAVCVAGYIDGVRLIDNLYLQP